MKKFFLVTIAAVFALLAIIEVFDFIERDQVSIRDNLKALGRIIDENQQQARYQQPGPGIACAMDAFMCSDGTYTGRSGTQCVFVCPDGSVHR